MKIKLFCAIAALMCAFVVSGCGEDKPKKPLKINITTTENKMTIPDEHKKQLAELDLLNVEIAKTKTGDDFTKGALDDRTVDRYSVFHKYGRAKIYCKDNEITKVAASMDGVDGERVLFDAKENKKETFNSAFSNFLKAKADAEADRVRLEAETKRRVAELRKYIDGDEEQARIILNAMDGAQRRMPQIQSFDYGAINATVGPAQKCTLHVNVFYKAGTRARLHIRTDRDGKVTDINASDAR